MDLEGFSDTSAILGSGVYALLLKGVVVYVGKSKTVLSRIYTHRNQYARKRKGLKPHPYLSTKAIHFDAVHVLTCAAADLDRVEREMINKFMPKHNVLLKDMITGPITLRINGCTIGMNVERKKPGTIIERRI